MNKLSDASKSVFNIITTDIAIFFISFVGSILITRYLGPELKGIQVYFLLILNVVVPIFLFGISGGIRYYISSKKFSLNNTLYSIIIIGFIYSILICAVVFFAHRANLLGQTGSSFDVQILFLLLFGIFLIINNNLLSRVLLSKSKFIVNNKLLLITAIIYFILAIVGILFDGGLLVILFALICSKLFYLVTLSINLIQLSKSNKKIWNYIFISKIHKYGIKVWISEVLRISNRRLDQLILGLLLAPEFLAYYSVCVTISELSQRIPQSVIQVFYNKIAESEQRENNIHLLYKIHRIVLAITFILAIFLIIFGYFLINILYGKEFLLSYTILIYYLPGVIIYMGTRIFLQFFSASGDPIKLSYIQFTGLIFSVPMYFLLIPKLGVIGAAISSSISYIITNVTAIYFFYRSTGHKEFSKLFLLNQDDIFWISDKVKVFIKQKNFRY